MRPLWIVLALLIPAACIDPLLGPARDADDPVTNFNALWTEFDRHYAFFELKGIDWGSVYDAYRPGVSPGMTDRALLNHIGAMLTGLEDGHVNVYTPFDTTGYTGYYEDHPASFDRAIITRRITDLRTVPGGRGVSWGDIDEFGYIHITRMHHGLSDLLDGVVAALMDRPGLIIDLRHNGGGSDLVSRSLAGHFTDRRFHYMTVRYRNGPDPGDFTAPIRRFIEPRTPRYPGPAVVLTNRRTYSSAEDLVLATRQLPQVTVVGDTSGGGSGSPIRRELPNGWRFRLSHWIATDPEGTPWEGVGLAPDVWVVQTADDAAAGEDPVLDAALERLRTAGAR